MSGTVRVLARRPRRAFVWLALGIVTAVGVAVLQLPRGASAQESTTTATATTGDLVVAVGGVGRVVQGSQTAQFFSLASGQVVTLLVEPGRRVVAGQPLALLDDGGVADAAVRQAQSNLATARLELRQKQMSHPADMSAAKLDVKRAEADLETVLGGPPGTHKAAIETARHNVQLARTRLDQVLAPANKADVRAAQAELKRAEAALAALLKPPVAPLPEVVAAAQQAVAVARQNLARAQASGTPAEINAAQLDLYRALAELASLQQPPAAPLHEEVEAAQAAVESAQLRLAKLLGPPNPADVKSARLELEKAKAELRQLRRGASPTAQSSAHQAVRSARAKFAQTTVPIDIALGREKVAAASSALASALSTQGLLTVRAPVAATVTSLLVGPGAQVNPTTPIAAVADLDQLAVSIDLSEFDVAQVKPGNKAVASIDALGGDSFKGTVQFVAPVGTDTNGVVTFPVRVSVALPPAAKPGMNASVRIVVAQAQDAVQVPLEAVSENDEGETYVTVVDDSGQETTRKVELGLENNKNVQIVKGLKAGEEVVLPETQPAEEE